ncbi:AraC family transcriptional regulator [soil metagenome]
MPFPMDPLSHVLSMLQVGSTLSSRLEAYGRWAFRYPAYASHIKLGSVLSGRLQMQLGDGPPVVLEEGDFYLLTNGQPFAAASIPPGPEQDAIPAYGDHRGADGVVRFGNPEDGARVALANGRFAFEGEVGDLLLRHLPPLIHLRAADPGTQPLAGLLDLLRWETGDARPGAVIAQANLASLVLVQALRVYLATTPQPQGWLGAMGDTRIGAALSALHGDLAHRWTVDSLAAVAGMSRTAFAMRFKRLTGSTPLDYLVHWRMTVARHALKHGDAGIADIAERVGYQSDTAFSAAFKRATGHSPGRFRLHGAATPGTQLPN